MGQNILDKYSILHFATGSLWKIVGLGPLSLLIFHIIFEIVENHDIGRDFINNQLTFWPGGKPEADSITNSISDIVIAMIGYYFADYLFRHSSLGKIYYRIVVIFTIIYFWIEDKIPFKTNV